MSINISINDFNHALKVIRNKVAQSMTSSTSGVTPSPILVALAGTPGSGKTTLATQLAKCLNDGTFAQNVVNSSTNTGSKGNSQKVRNNKNYSEVKRGNHEEEQQCVIGGGGGGEHIPTTVIPLDGYHLYMRELQKMPNSDEAVLRRGSPFTFNPQKYLKDIQRIKTRRVSGGLAAASSVLLFPRFEHSEKDPVENSVEVDLSVIRVIIVEGLYTLFNGSIPLESPVPQERPEDKATWSAAIKLYDVRIYINCPLEDTTERLTKRHMAAWGIGREEAYLRASGNDYENGIIVVNTEVNADFSVRSVPIHPVVFIPLVCGEVSKM
eukprot:Tbor_TRINITY_DN2999_c0_g1::TRINITY_DN2999_c0_g1_i1::g.1064::m.1064